MSNENTSLAPIILFVFNRPQHTQQTITALQKNKLASESDLIIYSDGAKTSSDEEIIAQMRDTLKQTSGFKSVTLIARKENVGCCNNVVDGVSEVLTQYPKAIVVEDDIVTSPYFLQFMNNALNVYRDKDRVFSISGFNYPPQLMPIPANYSYDTYFSYRNTSWGWAIWRDRWQTIDWDVSDYGELMKNKSLQKKFNRGGKDLLVILQAQMSGDVDTWDIQLCYAQSKQDRLSVWPVNSYVNNIGFDGSGLHCTASDRFNNDLASAKDNVNFNQIPVINPSITRAIRNIYHLSYFRRAQRKCHYLYSKLTGQVFHENRW